MVKSYPGNLSITTNHARRLKALSLLLAAATITAIAGSARVHAAAPAAPTPPTPATPASADPPKPALPPLPAAISVPHPGPAGTDGPYQPQPILQGGIVVPIWPANSKYLNQARVKEPEVYSMHADNKGRIQSIVNIHNPSIEFHPCDASINTGMVIILAAGGGHQTLNVGTEGADFVPFFRNYGINSVILRNRLARDRYNKDTDEVYDALQATRLVRAYAREFKIDPHKIGIMGFSAGAELATAASIHFNEFDAMNADTADPLAGTTSRPDFIGDIYPGPSPFNPAGNGNRGGNNGANPNSAPPIPANMPPSFIVCAGTGDSQHAAWADQWFAAMLAARVPNVEMHIYARGHHPGDKADPDEPPSMGGINDRGGEPYGTWGLRFIDWAKDLGFLGKPGAETIAARDAATYRGSAASGGRAGRDGG